MQNEAGNIVRPAAQRRVIVKVKHYQMAGGDKQYAEGSRDLYRRVMIDCDVVLRRWHDIAVSMSPLRDRATTALTVVGLLSLVSVAIVAFTPLARSMSPLWMTTNFSSGIRITS